MLSLHQLRCFLATLEHGSFTAAAGALGYAQPSISEQVRLLEQQLDTTLFRRVGRGLVPTEAARALQPHASAALAAVAEAGRAVASVRELLTGTVRFGLFRTARFYLTADLVADVLQRHPGVRVELVGQNSAEVLEHLRKGRLEAAVIALPVEDENMVVTPVLRDELVYVSADPARLHTRITPPTWPRPSWCCPTRAGARPTPPAASSPRRCSAPATRCAPGSRSRTPRRRWRSRPAGWPTPSPGAACCTASATGCPPGWAGPAAPGDVRDVRRGAPRGRALPASRVVVDLVTARMRDLDRAMRARTA
ncbi:LysR family transcriptional regulator [Catellatospora coxensis]